ncbi:MAG: hypothetical protein GEV08_07165 [Acidimicrobiia bacterium]|nr:hypothetical protein [Acidimicrobiia bacterium]
MEADGWSHHGTRAAFEADRWRDLELAAMGWHVLRTTKRALVQGGHDVAAPLGLALLERAS